MRFGEQTACDVCRLCSRFWGSCWGVSSSELSEVTFPSSYVQDTAFVSVRHVVNNLQSDPFVVLCMAEDGKALYCASRNGTVYRFTPGKSS